jgi:hypothetical protein
MRTSPELITTLKVNEVFVFGSNEAGIHGGGAAQTALYKFGAIRWMGEGLQGQSYAIPTKDNNIITLPVDSIARYVSRFIEFAKKNQKLTFLVTEIGCGLAGYKPQDMAPLFKEALLVDNIFLPESFNKILINQN